MILCVCHDDDSGTYQVGRAQMLANPAVFRSCHRAFTQIPRLAPDEDLFIIGHGVMAGDDGNPVIGDREEGHYYNAVDLFANLEPIFPAGYHGGVYVSACESAAIPRGAFSFAEVFKAQLQAHHPSARVYGHERAIGGAIPPPGDRSWVQAGI